MISSGPSDWRARFSTKEFAKTLKRDSGWRKLEINNKKQQDCSQEFDLELDMVYAPGRPVPVQYNAEQVTLSLLDVTSKYLHGRVYPCVFVGCCVPIFCHCRQIIGDGVRQYLLTGH
jgi:hypothetical protein